MDLKVKLNQMFILGLGGGYYKKLLSQGLGGIIFFSDDIKSSKQFTDLIYELKSKCSIPMFYSIDQEGGRVERTEHIHNGKKYLSAKYAFEKGEEFLAQQTQKIAEELCSYGINLNFAPCIDTNTNPANPIIGERAFSSNPDEVIKGEKIVSDIYRKNGIIPCLKHYPGHGDANSDSHLTLPEISLSMEDMKKYHIKPFKYAIQNGAEMIMAAHLYCHCFDKEKIPTSLSSNAINYLRDNLGFKGVIISDDMFMKGVSAYGDVEACIMGIKAGLNMFIYRSSDKKIFDLIQSVYNEALNDSELQRKIEDSYDRIISLKKSCLLINSCLSRW